MTTDQENQTRETSAPLYEARNWMKLLAVASFLAGLWLVASLVGIVVAWLPLWAGILILQSARAAEKAHLEGDQLSLIRSLSKLKTCFTLLGALCVLLVVILTVFLLAFLTGSLAGPRLF